MKPTAFLPFFLIGSLPRTIAVQLNITEAPQLDGSEPRTDIVDIPYVDPSIPPKDRPCPTFPYGSREVTLLTDSVTVPTLCILLAQQCRYSLATIDNDEPYANVAASGSTYSVHCYECNEDWECPGLNVPAS
ncbi:uncharacterized protein BDV17DRAFT_82210 [Aspergillus undulatus]|uniref:uncharacterized protein n=1 Tax=Aspergillus undulatus TaxID=1810928 RepID=UPI003CCE2F96